MRFILIICILLVTVVTSCSNKAGKQISPSESQAIQAIMDNPDTMDISKEYSFEFYEEQLDLEKTSEIIMGTVDHVDERIIPSGETEGLYNLVYDYIIRDAQIIDWTRKKESQGETKVSIVYGYVDLKEEKKYLIHELSTVIAADKKILAFKDKNGYALGDYIAVSDNQEQIFVLLCKNLFPDRQIPEKYSQSISAEEYLDLLISSEGVRR